jgi:ATP-dependent 26S proteasome regulatory subunit
VDLPDAENRMKILRIFLSQENLEPDFHFDKLAYATEGYSGSDLKVMHRC